MKRQNLNSKQQMKSKHLGNELPPHIAIIMDGNGRWAQRRGLKRHEGHRAGAEAAAAITEECINLGVERLTLYAFSLENWKRPKMEVSTLMRQLKRFLVERREEILEKNVRFTAIGRLELLPRATLNEVKRVMRATQHCSGMNLCLALSYSGRAEIADTARELASRAARGEIDPDDINEELFNANIYQPGPDPDLIIRTGGEMRISNFLLWEASYSELFFTETCWPDFKVDELHKALAAFGKRVRKYGRLEPGSRPDAAVAAGKDAPSREKESTPAPGTTV